MGTYRFYVLDPFDRVVASKSIECTGDSEAVVQARAYRDGARVEVWCDAILIACVAGEGAAYEYALLRNGDYAKAACWCRWRAEQIRGVALGLSRAEKMPLIDIASQYEQLANSADALTRRNRRGR